MFEKQYPQYPWKEVEVSVNSLPISTAGILPGMSWNKERNLHFDHRNMSNFNTCLLITWQTELLLGLGVSNHDLNLWFQPILGLIQILGCKFVITIIECDPQVMLSLRAYIWCFWSSFEPCPFLLLSFDFPSLLYLSQAELFQAFKELFQAASSRPAPYGICPNPSSRAIYAVDLMLKWSTRQNGEHLVFS